MQATVESDNSPKTPIGLRRGIGNLARLALDLTGESPHPESESRTVARSATYPSPPMSAPPLPLPPKPNQDGGHVGQAQVNHGTAGQQLRNMSSEGRTTLTTAEVASAVVSPLGPLPNPLPPPPPLYASLAALSQPLPPVRSFPPETTPSQAAEPQRLMHHYSPPARGAGAGPQTPYALPPPSQQPPQQSPQPHDLSARNSLQAKYGPLLPPLVPHGQAYAAAARPHNLEDLSLAAVRSQRKTAGHVASACVPCKKAHLRCDAQRPCTRCTSNKKEQSCIDVQHKKRGRPRLRDSAYDQQRPPDDLRGPLGAHAMMISVGEGPGTAMALTSTSRYDDPSRGRQYRVLKSQPSERPGRRLPHRAQLSDADVVSPPRATMTTQTPETVAYLNMRLEVVKASPSFLNVFGPGGVGARVLGRGLENLVMPEDRNRAVILQRRMNDEQSRKEPNYLPPIFSREQTDRVMQSLGFGMDEVSHFLLDHEEFLTFNLASDEPPRSLKVRLGLAKRDSIFFVVLLLVLNPSASRYPHPAYLDSSMHARETPPDSFYPRPQPLQPHQHQQQHPQHPPMPLYPPQQQHQQQHHHHYHHQQQRHHHHRPAPATFDELRSTAREEALAPHPSMPNLRSGFSPPSYAPSPRRPDHPVGVPAFQTPRSEMAPLPGNQATAQSPVQLPPIRSSPPAPAPSQTNWPREERRHRLDIDGLIETPEQPRRP